MLFNLLALYAVTHAKEYIIATSCSEFTRVKNGRDCLEAYKKLGLASKMPSNGLQEGSWSSVPQGCIFQRRSDPKVVKDRSHMYLAYNKFRHNVKTRRDMNALFPTPVTTICEWIPSSWVGDCQVQMWTGPKQTGRMWDSKNWGKNKKTCGKWLNAEATNANFNLIDDFSKSIRVNFHNNAISSLKVIADNAKDCYVTLAAGYFGKRTKRNFNVGYHELPRGLDGTVSSIRLNCARMGRRMELETNSTNA